MVITRSTMNKALTSWIMSTVMFGIVVGPFWRRNPESWFAFVSTVVIFPILLSFFPLLAQLSQELQEQRAIQREHWRAEYRQSPAARLLNLKDFGVSEKIDSPDKKG